MAISLNHTIVHAYQAHVTAGFLCGILGLEPYRQLGHFTVVKVGDTSLDLIETKDPINSRHFAFLVTDREFDDIFTRIVGDKIPYWADPFHKQPTQINHWDDGRGLYFDDPNGHLLEVITRPYGSGGLNAKYPNPLLLSENAK